MREAACREKKRWAMSLLQAYFIIRIVSNKSDAKKFLLDTFLPILFAQGQRA
jgi:hypothetical protein